MTFSAACGVGPRSVALNFSILEKLGRGADVRAAGKCLRKRTTKVLREGSRKVTRERRFTALTSQTS